MSNGLPPRVASVINLAIPYLETDEAEEAAQAVIDDLRLEREVSSMNPDCVRYVSKWELRRKISPGH